MNRPLQLASMFTGCFALLWPGAGMAQTHHHAAPQDTVSHHVPEHGAHHHGEMVMPMTGMYGSYSAGREASGTAWQPDVAGHEGVHVMSGAWMFMLHGFADVVYDDQDGPRGDTKVFSSNMGMATAQRALGPGSCGLRAMLSLEPGTIGKEGYPLLLQTGETADGVTPLIDRQHPHDLFMELAATYSLSSANRSLFVYAGLPGEPALGPPAFMHRFSGANIPVAPITHHWLDSSHITYGVLTGGAVTDGVKVEASAFRGREPDEARWDIESPKLDSHSFRLSLNPTPRSSLQLSYGRLHSPEQLEPEIDQDRLTASAMIDGTWGTTGRWEGTLAWGQNRNRPGHTLDAFAAEAAFQSGDRHTLFARAEHVEKDELFVEPDPRADQVFDVGEVTAGYRHDFVRRGPWAVGLGAAGTFSFVASDLRDDYGAHPLSALVFLRAALRSPRYSTPP